jgi:hypothetical protein
VFHLDNKTFILGTVIALQLGIIIGLTLNSQSSAVETKTYSFYDRSSMAELVEKHTNKSYEKLRILIKNQNKIIENDVSDPSLYTKGDTSNLYNVRLE